MRTGGSLAAAIARHVLSVVDGIKTGNVVALT